MPVRFRCPQCQQRLSIGSHKSGTIIECPTCKEQVRVPDDSELLSTKNATPSDATSGLEAEKQIDSLATAPAPAANTVTAPQPIEPPPQPEKQAAPVWLPKLDESHVSVPRYVIYLQGLLLGGVALVCLILGIFLGRAFSPTTSPIDPATMPCVVKGRVEYEDSQGERQPDLGGLILALPVGNQPEKSVPAEGLGIDDAPPKADHLGLRELESIGARIARVDPTGRYELRVPRGGKFLIVAISKTARRGEVQHKANITSEIGKYIAPATRLLGDHRYQMENPTLRDERTIDFVFAKDG